MIRLINAGYQFIHKNGIFVNRPGGSGDYAFVLFKSRAEVKIGGRTETADKDCCVLFSPNTPHSYRHLDKPFVNDWFHCKGNDMGDLLREIDFPTDKLIRLIDPFMVSRRIMDLQNLLRESSPFRVSIADQELRSLLMRLRIACTQAEVPDTAGRYYMALSAIRNELYGSPSVRVSVEELAARVNLSKSYFQHLYKELFNCPVMSDMINGRVEYAKYLLGNTYLPVGDIASLCGYENETHFMRQFKKFTGLTPSQYKKKRLESGASAENLTP